MRKTLDEFPCYPGRHEEENCMCGSGCRDRVDTGEWKCVVLPVFREHLKLERCARLLGIFDRRWASKLGMLIGMVSVDGTVVYQRRWKRFHEYIRASLKQAGL